MSTERARGRQRADQARRRRALAGKRLLRAVAPAACLLVGVAVGPAPAPAAGSVRPAWLDPVSVGVAPLPALRGPLRIGFNAHALPHGGFYYAVTVLRGFGPPGTLPSCAISSDMGKTEYGFPRSGRRLRLSVLPARSNAERWCAGGTYLGAVYAVPHRPRCTYSQPCYGRATQVGPCWIVGEGHRVCGVVVIPRYSYPGGLPRPLDSTARVVAHFTVRFPPAPA